MNILHLKKKLTIQGAGGGGGGGGQTPSPPDVKQYPSVLAPPQFSNLNTINSFSYAEIIDLISDGPIEGLVNKNGKKVYDENIFEGIFLNDTPIKETSSEKRQSIPISFIKDKLKYHWSYSSNNSIIDKKLITNLPRISIINPSEIDDVNFKNPITITSYHPNDSVYNFIDSLNGSFDAVSLIQKAFDLSPIINERPFLTKIYIPKFTVNLSKEKFDITEGGSNSPSPLKIGITDLSNYIYFSIGSETLNSFNYFELPRSFINNNSFTVAGKKTFKKNLISSNVYYQYEIFDLNIYIWSIYNDEVGIKNIDNILDRYLNNIYIFQNDFSLFNYNLVQSEFKNGSEVQAPLKYFTNVQIDTEYGKELIGPFLICNCFNPTSAMGNGGIQRVVSYGITNSFTLPALNQANIECETSDDIRYVQAWPIDYNTAGDPYLLTNVKLNYTQFDKTSSSRTSQSAVPVTHYISNDNVEEVFVSVSVQQLFDTNHVDLVSDNSASLGSQAKLGSSERAPAGVNSYASVIGYTNPIGFTQGAVYFLVYGTSATNGYVIDGFKTTDSNIYNSIANISTCLTSNFFNFIGKNNAYYNAISNNGLCTKVVNFEANVATNKYLADTINNLINYEVPNDAYQIKESFNISLSKDLIESKLKLLSDDGNSFYCFGLSQNETINGGLWNNGSDFGTTINAKFSSISKTAGYNFYLVGYGYKTAAISELNQKAVVVHIINSYIDWDAIIDKSQATGYKSKLDKLQYPNITKYIINPYINLNLAKNKLIFTSYSYAIIGNLYLIGINGSYLKSQPTFFKDTSLTKLNEIILDQLLEEFLLKTDQSAYFTNIDSNNGTFNISDYSSTKALESSLLKFENGKLIGNSSIYNFTPYTIASTPYINSPVDINYDKNKTNSLKTIYNFNNIFIYRSQYLNTDSINDRIFYYNLYTNVVQNASTTPINNGSVNAAALQNITAGTKLPAIVVVDVETGYESKEKEIYRNAYEYFSYRYNIFGMSTDNAIIDLGRTSNPFVNSCKLSLDRGGYVSKYRNTYYPNQPLYLIELICCNSSLTTSVTGYYFVDRKDDIYIGEMDLYNLCECSNLNISYTTSDIIKSGVQQLYSGSFNGESNIYTLSSNYSSITEKLKSNLLNNNQFYCYINHDKVVNLGYAINFLQTTNLIPNGICSSDVYISAHGVCCNSNIFDTYKLIDGACCLNLNIYNYKYSAYQTIFINPLWTAKTVNNINYYDYTNSVINSMEAITSLNFVIYTDLNTINNSPLSLKKLLSLLGSNIVLIKINSIYMVFGLGSSITATSLKMKINATPTLIKNYIDNSSVLTSQINIDNNIIDQIVSNAEYITQELFKSNLFSGSLLQLITAENLRNSLLNKKYAYQLLYKDNPLNSINGGYLSTYVFKKNINSIGNLIQILSTDIINIKSTDARLYFSSLTIKDPVSLTATFWTIYNTVSKKYSIIFKPPTKANGYSEISQDINYLNFEKIIDAYNGFRIDLWMGGGVYYNNFSSSYPLWLRNDGYKQVTLNGSEFNSYYGGWVRNGSTSANIGIYPVSNEILIGAGSIYYWNGSFQLWPGASIDTLRFCISHNSLLQPKNNNWRAYGGLGSVYKSFGIINIVCAIKDNGDCSVPSRINDIIYYKNICSSKTISLTNFDTSISQNYCLITADSVNGNGNLQNFEYALINNGLFPNDIRLFSYDTSPAYTESWPGSNWVVSYYKGITLSNVYYNTKNTFANNAGVQIQIPAPKNDKYGNPMRRYVKVTRRSHETLSPLIGKKISLNKITEIIPQKFSYPFSSIIGTKIDSRAFSQIPTRTFNSKLKKILVPSNYFPNNEDEEDVRYLDGTGLYKIYDGDWDGTFKLSWSNNPAWVLMDLLINKRYGLGNYIESDQVDIWELYKIARWCDCVDDNGFYYGVDDGYGGTEPRHAFNALITDKFNIFDMINQVASVFRGHVYYMNSLITFDDDRIKPIIGEFNNNDVKDGLFNYTNHKKDDEFTAVDIAYVDSKDNYKPKIEYVEDSDGIRQRGILKKNINAFGITSRGQARRFGKYFLYQTAKENSNTTFTTDMKALMYKPGDLIRINDELMNSMKNFGSVKNISYVDSDSFKVVIDKAIDENIYDVSQISLYTPIAKPKYDDYYANAQFIPKNLIFEVSSPMFGTLCEVKYGSITTTVGDIIDSMYSGKTTKLSYKFNMNTFDTTSPIKSFSGIVDVTYEIYTGLNVAFGTCTNQIVGYLNYMQNNNINNQPSKYGYWEFVTGIGDKQDKLLFDILQNESLKYQLPYKNYFFEYFDTGRYLRYSGVDSSEAIIYSSLDFNPKESKVWSDFPNDSNHTGISIKKTCTQFLISDYQSPTISYNSIIEGDRPSIDTFYITGYRTGSYKVNQEILNEYSELYITRSGKNNLNNDIEFDIKKESVLLNEDRLVIGSSYSLNLLNKRDKIYKIMSITENYINEYNILATEYNLDKFKEIEENAGIDNLQNTFNFLTAQAESKQASDKERLAAPVISSLRYIIFNAQPSLEIKWANVLNANLFKIYIQTPSKQTSNYEASANYSSDYNKNISSYLKIWALPTNPEIGTYTVSIQSLSDDNSIYLYKMSPFASKSVSIMNY